MKTLWNRGNTAFQVSETPEELEELLDWNKLGVLDPETIDKFPSPSSDFILVDSDTLMVSSGSLPLPESIITKGLLAFLTSQGHIIIHASGVGWKQTSKVEWRPDVSTLNPATGLITVYEAKNPQAGRGDTRSGFAQALDGFIDGYVSYVVLPVQCLSHAQRLRDHYPVGLITYKLESEEIVFSTQWDGKIPSLASEVTEKYKQLLTQVKAHNG